MMMAFNMALHVADEVNDGDLFRAIMAEMLAAGVPQDEYTYRHALHFSRTAPLCMKPFVTKIWSESGFG